MAKISHLDNEIQYNTNYKPELLLLYQTTSQNVSNTKKKNHSTTVSLVILVVLEWSYNLSLFWILMNSAHFSCAVLPAWSLAHPRCDDILKSGNQLLRDMGGLWITKHQLWCNFQAKTQRKHVISFTHLCLNRFGIVLSLQNACFLRPYQYTGMVTMA